MVMVLGACTSKPQTKPEPVKANETVTEKPFSNPALIYGSDFLSFLSAEKMAGKPEELLRYTSNKSKAIFNTNELIGFYNHTNINLHKKLKALRKINDSLFVMTYQTSAMATRNVTTITVSIEKDTARLVLPIKLNRFLD